MGDPRHALSRRGRTVAATLAPTGATATSSLLPVGGDIEGDDLRTPLSARRRAAQPGARAYLERQAATAAQVTLRRGRLLVVESTASPPHAPDPGGRP
jgi:hypothetical protein